jgi:hypothetical protein
MNGNQLSRRFRSSAVLLLLAVGLVARLPGLGRDLWYDEALSLFDARGTEALATRIIPNGPEFTGEMFIPAGSWRDSLLAVSRAEFTPPLYYLLLRLWMTLFGESNRALRWLSVIIGLAAILAVFLLGRKLFDERVGLAAAGVLAVLPLHVQYSQEIRAYPMMVLLLALASWAFWSGYQAIGRHEERKYWALYAGLMAASLYTHYFAPGGLIAHGLFALVQPRPVRLALVKRLALVTVAVVILFAPWLASSYLANQVQMLKYQPPSPPFWAPDLLRRIAFMIYQLSTGNLPDANLKSVSGLVLVSLIAGTVMILIAVVRRRDKLQATFFAFLLLVSPILFAAGLAAGWDRIVLLTLPRYVLPAVIGLSLLLAAALFASRQRAVSVLIAALIVVLSVQFQVKWDRVRSSSEPLPFAEWAYGNLSLAVTEVDRKIGSDELVLFDDWVLAPTWNVYQRTAVPEMLMGREYFYAHQPMDFDSRWQQVESKYAGIYLVRRAGGPPSEVVQRVEERYRLASRQQLGRMEISHYVKPSSERSGPP